MTGYKLVRANVETAADAGDKWWKSLDKKQQDQYLKLHPNSKYGKKKGKAPEAPKTKAKPAVVPTKLAGPKLKKAANPAARNKPSKSKSDTRTHEILDKELKEAKSRLKKLLSKLESGKVTGEKLKELKLAIRNAKKDIQISKDFKGLATRGLVRLQ